MSSAYEEAILDLAHLPDFLGMKHGLATLSDISGLSNDSLRFVLIMLAYIPLGWAFRLIKNNTMKHITSLLLGVFCCYFIVGLSSLNVFTSSALCYILTEVLLPSSKKALSISNPEDRKKALNEIYVKRKNLGYFMFLVFMLYICFSHIYRIYVDYLGYRMDFTAPQMMLTLKLVSYAWQRVDGESLNDGLTLDDIKGEEEHRNIHAIRSRPSVLAYFGWIYHFNSVFAGPSLDYMEYANYIDGTLWKKFGLKELPFSFKPALKKLLCVVLVYPGIMIAGMYPLTNYINTDQFYIDFPSVWGRVAYVTFFNGFARFKYYFAWYLAEAGCVASGIALSNYDAKTGETEWESCNNCRAYAVETCTSTNDLINNWNIRVSLWLKRMVYLRIPLPPVLKPYISHKGFASLATKFTSAFWHGFYPGYYIFFGQVWFIQFFETKIRRILLPYFSKPNPDKPNRPILVYPGAYGYNLIMNFFSLFSLNWLGSSFVILEFWPSISILLDSYFWYHVLGFTTLVFIPMMLKSKKVKTQKTENANKVDFVEKTKLVSTDESPTEDVSNKNSNKNQKKKSKTKKA